MFSILFKDYNYLTIINNYLFRFRISYMLPKIIFLLLSLTVPIQGNRIQVNPNITVDYALTFQSSAEPSTDFHSLRFPTVYYDSPALITFHGDLDDCKSHCATLDICNGIYQEWNESLLMTTVEKTYTTNTSNISNLTWENTPDVNRTLAEDNPHFCYLLSDLGLGYEEVNVTSHSYTKIESHNYTQALGNNSIGVYIVENQPINAFGNATVYLDLNHNGVLDEMEPNISTESGREVYFRNLSSGLYLVRTVSPDFCHQIYPGMRGDEYIFSQMGDGFIDTVNTYYHHGHSSFIAPHGGLVGEPQVVSNKNFSFILGSNNQTYLSFYPENNITVGFVDETVVDELIIEVYGSSSTWAHVSVSHDNYHFYQVGILYSETTTFNLTLTDLDLPVAFVRLHFMGEDPYIPLNIVRIYSPQNDVRSPEFGFLVGLPVVNYEFGFYRFVIFYHDCYNEQFCEEFCYYMSNTYDLEESCLTGCNLFYTTENCVCPNYQNIDYVDFYGDEFNEEWCYKGCHYELGWSVGPEFVPLVDHTGVSDNMISSSERCEDYCLYDLYDRCIDNQQCNSFSYDLQNNGELYAGTQYQDSPSNFIMIRRDIYDNFTEKTSTTTTSQTSSSTLTTSSTSVTSTSATVTSTTSTSRTATTATVTTTTVTTATSTTATTATVTTATSTTASSSTLSITSSTTGSNTRVTSSTQTFADSGSGKLPDNGDNSVRPSTSNNKKSNSKTIIAILVSLFVVIIAGFGMIGYIIYRRRNTMVNAPQINREILGFDNPVYNQQYENQNVENPPVLYQDTEAYDPDADYLEVTD